MNNAGRMTLRESRENLELYKRLQESEQQEHGQPDENKWIVQVVCESQELISVRNDLTNGESENRAAYQKQSRESDS